MSNLAVAPVAFFAFNRPKHTCRTLAALAANELAADTDLHIFCDGPRSRADEEAVAQVREICRNVSGFASLHIHEQETNQGIAKSVIAGVTFLFEKHERVIVFEDDVLASPGTLRFFNACLNRYQSERVVFNISGWSPDPKKMGFPGDYPWDVYFIPRFNGWGWATWKDRWQSIDWNFPAAPTIFDNPYTLRGLSQGGADIPLMVQSILTRELVDVWDVQADFARFTHGRLGLNPIHAYVENIGCDSSGVHCGEAPQYAVDISAAPSVVRFPEHIFVDDVLGEKYRNFFSGSNGIPESSETTENKQCPLTWEQTVAWMRGQPDQQNLVKACFLDDPLLDAAKRFHQSEEWAETRKRLPASPGKALDLGAGRGIGSYALAMDGFDVIALEPDPSPVVGAGAVRNLVAASGLPIAVVEEWGEHLPFADHSFDLIYARQILHHARCLPDLCKEAARVLKPGGIFIATREHVVDRAEDMPAFLAGHPVHHLFGGENAFSLPQYISAIAAAGFRFREILGQFDNVINFFPLSEEELTQQLRSLWRWPNYRPSSVELTQNARRIIRTPGRLFTFVAQTPGLAMPEDAASSLLPHTLIVQQAINDASQAVLNEANRRLDGIEAQIAQHGALRQQHGALRQQHEALRQQHEALRQQHEALRQQHEALRQESNALRYNLRHLFRWLYRKLRTKLTRQASKSD